MAILELITAGVTKFGGLWAVIKLLLKGLGLAYFALKLRQWYRGTIGHKTGRPDNVRPPIKQYIDMLRFIQDFETALQDKDILFNADKINRFRESGTTRIIELLTALIVYLTYVKADIEEVIERNVSYAKWVGDIVNRKRSVLIGGISHHLELLLESIIMLHNESSATVTPELLAKVMNSSHRWVETHVGTDYLGYISSSMPFLWTDDMRSILYNFLAKINLFFSCFYVMPPKRKSGFINNKASQSVQRGDKNKYTDALEYVRLGYELGTDSTSEDEKAKVPHWRKGFFNQADVMDKMKTTLRDRPLHDDESI